MTNHIGVVYLKTKLSYHDRSDKVSYEMKTRQDNDVTDHTSEVYIKNDTELS